MRGEQDLVRTLRTAAGQVERIDLAEGVAARRRGRRTRQRVRVALAAAAVVAIAGGTTVALSGEGRRAQPAVTATPSAPRFTSAAEVWPNAVAKMPTRNSEGMSIHPVTALSATEVLMLASPNGASWERAMRLEVYDTARKTARVLGEIPPVKKISVPVPQALPGPAVIAVDSRYIAWSARADNRPRMSFWIMPRAGGAARKVVEAAMVADAVALSGDSLVWSLAKGGVYRVPLTGGTPARLPGTDGLHLTAWPWAAGYEGRALVKNQNRVVNLETGQSFDVSVPKGARMLRCVSQWCVGELKNRVVVQRVDGSERKTLPSALRPYGPSEPLGDGDRFALVSVHDPDKNKPGVPLAVMYDLATGMMTGLGERIPGTEGRGVTRGVHWAAPSTTLFWDQDLRIRQQCEKGRCIPRASGGGKEYTLLNLAAVTR
ncbi:hypothetical protein [Nonomuraea basaltis]|uniref:hypothetical protein n=1 Tax=Nonomuraea basaltis TaxID=2495887 RepID=UPI00110C6D02|nr:hypothetical protein [Nonomuraea basaltis]TMR90737.1 hypothetical protein EJK15_53680 [Nonomuraea basaltis]